MVKCSLLLFFFTLYNQQKLDYLEKQKNFFSNNLELDENAELIKARLLKNFSYNKEVFKSKKQLNSYNRVELYMPQSQKKIKQIHLVSNSYPPFKNPYYLHFHNRSLYISDHVINYLQQDVSKRLMYKWIVDTHYFFKSIFGRLSPGGFQHDLIDTHRKLAASFWHIKHTGFQEWKYDYTYLNFERFVQNLLNESFGSIYYFFRLVKKNNRSSIMFLNERFNTVKNFRTAKSLNVKFDKFIDAKILNLSHKLLKQLGRTRRVKTAQSYQRYVATVCRSMFFKYKTFVLSFKSLSNVFFELDEFSLVFWNSFFPTNYSGSIYWFFNYKAALKVFSHSKKIRNIKKNRFKVLKYQNSKTQTFLQ